MHFFRNLNAYFFSDNLFFLEVFLFSFGSFLSKSHCNSINSHCVFTPHPGHEASINNSGNTFMTTIACDLNLTHVIVNLGTYQ